MVLIKRGFLKGQRTKAKGGGENDICHLCPVFLTVILRNSSLGNQDLHLPTISLGAENRMRMIKRVCVFCGSSSGARPEYRQTAQQLGLTLARQKIELIYGGGRLGLMGQLAQTVLMAGGKVIGVIPQQLVERELAFTDVSDLRVVGSMHERKALMAEMADGFIAMPGGIGTFEEFFEILTWAQLGFHEKPCAVLNIAGYYDGLLALCDNAVKEGFLRSAHRQLILEDPDPEILLEKMKRFEPALLEKWLDKEHL